MKMAKASPEDLKVMYDFFNMLEEMNSCYWEPETEEIDTAADDALSQIYKMWKAEMREADYDLTDSYHAPRFWRQAFLDYWLPQVECSWRRVVGGYEVMLDNCADPTLDHLDFNAKIKEAFALLDAKEAAEKEKGVKAEALAEIEDLLTT